MAFDRCSIKDYLLTYLPGLESVPVVTDRQTDRIAIHNTRLVGLPAVARKKECREGNWITRPVAPAVVPPLLCSKYMYCQRRWNSCCLDHRTSCMHTAIFYAKTLELWLTNN